MSRSMKVKPTDDPIDFVKLAEKYTVDKERQQQRMKTREDKLRQLSNSFGEIPAVQPIPVNNNNNNEEEQEVVEEQEREEVKSKKEEVKQVVEQKKENLLEPTPHQRPAKRFLKSLRYLRQEPTLVKYDTGSNTGTAAVVLLVLVTGFSLAFVFQRYNFPKVSHTITARRGSTLSLRRTVAREAGRRVGTTGRGRERN